MSVSGVDFSYLCPKIRCDFMNDLICWNQWTSLVKNISGSETRQLTQRLAENCPCFGVRNMNVEDIQWLIRDPDDTRDEEET